jgi:hypothetical protein
MKITKIKQIKQSLLVITIFTGMFAVGCELIVDFDRTKIPVEVNEASIPDVNIPETLPPTEGGSEAGADADAGTQQQSDASDASDASDSG